MADETSYKEKNELLWSTWSRMVSCISHDLKTPLLTIQMLAESLEPLLISLKKGYQLAVENKLMDAEISKQEMRSLEADIISSIRNNAKEMIDFLNVLHPWKKKLLADSKDIQILSINFIIEEVLKKYCDKERINLIHKDLNYDFNFKADPFFIEHLLANILKQAFVSIQLGGKGGITISTEKKEQYNILSIRDTGAGMSEYGLQDVFTTFFSVSNNEIVPHLGFCKLALLQTENDITCHSEKGEFTEFTIKLKPI